MPSDSMNTFRIEKITSHPVNEAVGVVQALLGCHWIGFKGDIVVAAYPGIHCVAIEIAVFNFDESWFDEMLAESRNDASA